jgi:ACS family hexuronate transporter-like MFS transporter
MSEKMTRYRWTICSLIFFATTINYLDRAVISLLKSTLSAEFHWSETDYADIVIVFQLCYAFGLLGVGGLIDRVGTKVGYAWATVLWSFAAIGHALANSTMGFMVARGFLGVTEAGNFPSAIKTVAEWFPKKERALATGIFNSGTNVGAIIAPLTVPFIAAAWGWQWAFILTGLIGFIWLVLWYFLYDVPKNNPNVSQSELNHILSDGDEAVETEDTTPKLSWFQLLGFKQTWAFALGKFLTDPVWWFYLFWMPDFLEKQYNLSKTQIAFPIAIAYTMATIGSIAGGWLPMYFIKNGKSVAAARKTAMFIYALCVIPVISAQYLGAINMWLAISVIGLAMAAHQAWSANIFTTVSDMFPKNATASVTGIGGMFGALGGILISKSAGKLFEHYQNLGDKATGYLIMFLICGFVYLLAWTLMHFLVSAAKK